MKALQPWATYAFDFKLEVSSAEDEEQKGPVTKDEKRLKP